MSYQFLCNTLVNLQNRIMNQNASVIPTNISKEGQCDYNDGGKEKMNKMCELDAFSFKQQNAEVLE